VNQSIQEQNLNLKTKEGLRQFGQRNKRSLAVSSEYGKGHTKNHTNESQATSIHRRSNERTTIEPYFNNQSMSIAERSIKYAQQVQCPTCLRSYSKKAGERHIPQCKNIINKPQILISNNKVSSSKIAELALDHRESIATSKTHKDKSLDFLKAENLSNRDDYGAPEQAKKMKIVTIMSEKFCTKCGHGFMNNDAYCGLCGKKRQMMIPKKKRIYKQVSQHQHLQDQSLLNKENSQ